MGVHEKLLLDNTQEKKLARKMVRNGFFSRIFRGPFIAEDDEQKFIHFKHFSRNSNNMI